MKSAFTILELLVVIAIIAVLAGFTVPMYERSIANGRAAACLSNLRQLGVALNLYLAEHNATFPALAAGRSDKSQDAQVIDNTLDRYANDPRVFACPADSRGLAAATGTSYYWNNALNNQTLANLHFMFIADASRIPILLDKEGFHSYSDNKVNVLYGDGHAVRDLRFFTHP